jgi:hypothetical protein
MISSHNKNPHLLFFIVHSKKKRLKKGKNELHKEKEQTYQKLEDYVV